MTFEIKDRLEIGRYDWKLSLSIPYFFKRDKIIAILRAKDRLTMFTKIGSSVSRQFLKMQAGTGSNSQDF